MTDLLNFSKASRPSLDVGAKVHVFDCDWLETTIVYVFGAPDNIRVEADHSYGKIRMPIRDICWNDTQKRHEYIRSGTPVY